MRWSSYGSIATLVLYMVQYGFGSAVAWMITSELFSQVCFGWCRRACGLLAALECSHRPICTCRLYLPSKWRTVSSLSTWNFRKNSRVTFDMKFSENFERSFATPTGSWTRSGAIEFNSRSGVEISNSLLYEKIGSVSAISSGRGVGLNLHCLGPSGIHNPWLFATSTSGWDLLQLSTIHRRSVLRHTNHLLQV